MIMMVYQKANGEVIKRKRDTYPPYRVGDRTSMGWTVLNILHNYKGRYYSKSDYDFLITKDFLKEKKIIKLKRTIVKVYNNLVYPIALLIMMRLLEVLTK